MPSAPAAPPLDTRLRLETPEGVDLLLSPAGPLVRARAFAVDLAVRGALAVAGLVVLGQLGKLGLGLGLLLLFLLNWWYPVLFEVLNQGRTPGKQLLGLRVVHQDGTPVGWGAALLRNLLRFVDMLPFAYCLGLLSSLAHPAFKRLGDIAAGTLVVYREQAEPRPNLPNAEPERAPMRLDLQEQRAILAFAERAGSLSQARREELAGLLAEPLQVLPEQAEARLNGIARGLLGAS